MNEKEKEAIELIKYIKEHNSLIGFKNTERRDLAETVLNLIEKKDKIIDLMAEYMEEEFAEYQLDYIYAELNNCNGMERNWTRGKEAEIKDIKRYFNQKIEKGE